MIHNRNRGLPERSVRNGAFGEVGKCGHANIGGYRNIPLELVG